MFLKLLSAATLGGKYVNEKIEQNRPYYGTERELFKNNKQAQELDKKS